MDLLKPFGEEMSVQRVYIYIYIYFVEYIWFRLAKYHIARLFPFETAYPLQFHLLFAQYILLEFWAQKWGLYRPGKPRYLQSIIEPFWQFKTHPEQLKSHNHVSKSTYNIMGSLFIKITIWKIKNGWGILWDIRLTLSKSPDLCSVWSSGQRFLAASRKYPSTKQVQASRASLGHQCGWEIRWFSPSRFPFQGKVNVLLLRASWA